MGRNYQKLRQVAKLKYKALEFKIVCLASICVFTGMIVAFSLWTLLETVAVRWVFFLEV
jgi:hypothetical protein